MPKSAQMYLFLKILSLIVLGIILVQNLAKQSLAGDLGALVRIDRLTPNTSTGGIICATPETVGVETSIQIVFPSGMTVNQTASNWTVATDKIPDDSTPLPGITTATNISGQTITFPSDDLVVGTQYCFRFSSTNTLNTALTTSSYEGVLRTRSAGNTVIDSVNFAIPIVSNNNITVTATAPAQPTDFQATLTMTNPQNGSFHQDTELSYELSYGSLLPHASNLTIEAQWALGTVQGGSTPSIDLLDYVIGSASYGYNGAPPVIDSVNRKISWTLPAFPGYKTGQTVSFKLRTNSVHQTNQFVNFSVNGRLLGPGTQTPDSTVNSIFYNRNFITPTPYPTCIPNACPTATPAPTTPPTPTKAPLPRARISDIEVRTISSNDATVYVSTTQPASIRIDVGESTSLLKSESYSNSFSKQHLLRILSLKPGTTYYFRVVATDPDKTTTTSDLYTFTTSTAVAPVISLGRSLLITSEDIVLADNAASQTARFIIPTNTPYSFKFELESFENLRSVRVITRSNSILGINSYESQPGNSESVDAIEISPGEFIGKLYSPSVTGKYNVMLQISDYKGNLIETPIAKMAVTQPLRVVSPDNNGIENAKVTFYVFNSRTRMFELLSSSHTSFKNPNRSQPNGHVTSILPQGEFKVEISALGYQSTSYEFTIDFDKETYYPTIVLEKKPFDPFTYVQYLSGTSIDVINATRTFSYTLGESFRFFDLLAFILATFFVMFLTVATSKKLSVPVTVLPYYFFYHITRIFHQNKHNYLVHGKVVTLGAGEAVEGAIIYISYPGGKIISHSSTNLYGEFLVRVHESRTLKITVSKKGFKAHTRIVKPQELENRIFLTVLQIGRPKKLSINNIRWYLEYIMYSFFEAILIITLVLEILFIFEFGLIKVLPFLILSIFNIILWAIDMRVPKR